VIIFDLGGVVFKEPEHFVFDTLASEIRAHFPHDFKPPRIFLRAFDFANLVAQRDLKMPWLFGDISGTEIARHILDHIDNPIHATFFTSEYERLLIKHGAIMMFDPEQLTVWTLLNQEAFALIKQCKTNGIRVLILSNWDPLSFPLIKQKYPELFECFAESNIFIPATTGYSKPDKKVYQFVLDALMVKPEECYFIDDSKKNVEAAAEMGIKAILHSNWPETIQKLSEETQSGFF
jgi:FMN phosphatase YigB (HAD superfamily)